LCYANIVMNKKITVCVITKNEAHNIERCLASVQWADELVVVDSGSADKTVELAEKLGAKVISADWPGWAKQKNRAIDAASNDWIISLDADEWLPEHSEEIIRKAVVDEAHDSYTLKRKTFFLGRWIAHMGWYPDQQIRLFRKSATRFLDVPVHEKVKPTPKTTGLELDILHESYTSLEQYIAKNNAYSSAQAEQQKEVERVWLKLLVKPKLRFFQTYFLQAGFLDGWQGFVLAVLRSWYDFVVLVKILEHRRTSRRP
jgi:glycosyltransferase involved in cell wall biosynthesis